MSKATELRNLTVEELQEKVKGLRRDLMQRRFEAKTGKLERQSVIRETRRDMARMLTIIREKEIEEKA